MINNIKDLAYELYKTDWMSRISTERRFNALRDYYLNVDTETRYSYTFEEWISEQGYDGELYVCFAEFLQTEYLEDEYMKALLADTALYEEYLKDIKEG